MTLILLRHGQSEWNKANLFTGWVDVPLSIQGVEEALSAGEKIAHIPIDTIVTSALARAQTTALLAIIKNKSNKTPVILSDKANHKEWSKIHNKNISENIIPIMRAWQLNERYYGELQGLNKDETRTKYGEDQVQLWRRSYDIAPPGGESLEMTASRTLPYFKSTIIPMLREGKNILISAHGNSLRAIIMFIENIDRDKITKLEIATGIPSIYLFKDNLFCKSQE